MAAHPALNGGAGLALRHPSAHRRYDQNVGDKALFGLAVTRGLTAAARGPVENWVAVFFGGLSNGAD
jgi:hypothetical protein